MNSSKLNMLPFKQMEAKAFKQRCSTQYSVKQLRKVVKVINGKLKLTNCILNAIVRELYSYYWRKGDFVLELCETLCLAFNPTKVNCELQFN